MKQFLFQETHFDESETVKKDSPRPPDIDEEIPAAAPLVVPGYNLPENIFNSGKPFYLEKNPFTGMIDFNVKPPDSNAYDEYDYSSEEKPLSTDIFDKSNIDRKDGTFDGHKPVDVNQLTPNLYDFLNLPVKYNPDKYVYPLISNSYANTKVQGNVNKNFNHKGYVPTTYKPLKTPTYVSAKTSYFNKDHTPQKPEYVSQKHEITRVTKTTSTVPVSTTKIYPVTPDSNLMQSGMNHPSFKGEYHETTQRSTTQPNVEMSKTTTTTKKVMSLFEQLFGDYEEPTTQGERTKPPFLFVNLPTNKKKLEEKVPTPAPTSATSLHGENVVQSSSVEDDSNEHDYDYNEAVTDNIAVESKPITSTTTPVTSTQTRAPITQKLSTTKPSVTSEKHHILQSGFSTVKPSTTTQNLLATSTTKFKNNVTWSDSFQKGNGVDEYKKVVLTTPEDTVTSMVTSLPLGENHVTHISRQPIIVATQHLREQLNNEKILPRPFGFASTHLQTVPSKSSIHIGPDQDSVSFVVGNHQNVEGQYVDANIKDLPYNSDPFKPLFTHPEYQTGYNQVNYVAQPNLDVRKPAAPYEDGISTVSIHPLRESEASLAIGVPLDVVKKKPGQVVDDSLGIDTEKIEYPKGNGPKVVFPGEQMPYHRVPNKPTYDNANREVLKLNSKPMFHQLPSDLTPPTDKSFQAQVTRERPPWDPRPGHFHTGRPEYARPPRPPHLHLSYGDHYKRIDSLPNILPQFRPNMKFFPHHYEPPNRAYARQPLLERPSNRPIDYIEKLQPPPPPPKNLQALRKIPPSELESKNKKLPDEDDETKPESIIDQFIFFPTPPKVLLPNRRNGDPDGEVETLQMIQAKHEKDVDVEPSSPFARDSNDTTASEKPLYVVYPVNTPPLKLDAIDLNKKEAVVIGTRAELPLPPSKIKYLDDEDPSSGTDGDFLYDKRHDSPILKPHSRPNVPKSDFPYPLEQPDPSLIGPDFLDTLPYNNDIDDLKHTPGNNQWNSLEDTESKMASEPKAPSHVNQISTKLKIYAEKPIAVAYTPTEPQPKGSDKFSLPNYAGVVIPEIRAGNVEDRSKITIHNEQNSRKPLDDDNRNAFANLETTHVPQLDFQAPFHASVNIDNTSHGWLAIRDKTKITDEMETTTAAVITTSEFDMENFKPQFLTGFTPIYTFPSDAVKKDDKTVERQK